MREVTDPKVLEMLNGSASKEVTDPALLAQLNGELPQQEAPAEQRSPFMQRMQSDFEKRKAQVAQAEAAQPTNEYGISKPLQVVGANLGLVSDAIANVAGSGLRYAGDAAKAGAGAILPDQVSIGLAKAAGFGGEAAKNTAGEVLNDSLLARGIKSGVEGYSQFVKENPEMAANINAVGNIAINAPLVKPLGTATVKAVEYTADAGVNKTGLVKAAPQIASDFVNPTGLNAIEAINKGYETAKDTVSQAEKLVRAKPVPINSAGLLDDIDGTINNLSDKVAIGSKEQVALAQLSKIRDNLIAKNGLPDTNDLIDIRAAINAGLPVNKFPVAGVGDKLSLKSQVDDLLGNVSKEVPEFGAAYKNYRAAATDIASRYTGNKNLKNFWQPEDYTAYKAFKNGNAELPYNDATLGRANQFLDKLNTQDTGKINAVVKAMPQEVAAAVLKAASKRADSLNPNIIRALGSAVMNLKSGNVAGAVRNVVSDMVTPSKPNLVKDYYNLYKKNPTAPNTKLSKESLQNAFEAKKAAAAGKVEPTVMAISRKEPNYAQKLRRNLMAEEAAPAQSRGALAPKAQQANFEMPLITKLKRSGGVRVGSVLDKELRHMGITPKSMPGLFRKNGGLRDVDRFPANEMEGYGLKAGEEADNGYVNRNTILDAISDEYGFYKKSAQLGVDDVYLNDLGVAADRFNIKTDGKTIQRLESEVNEAIDYEQWLAENLDVNDSLEAAAKKAKKLEQQWLESRGDAWEPDTIQQITLDELEKYRNN